MKRRQFLKLLGFASPVLLASCFDAKSPSAATMVSGIVIDENDMPIEGASIRMSGIKQKGLSGIGTFNTNALTDKDGNYSLSYLVPKGIDFVVISPEGTLTINDQTHGYSVQKNGIGLYVIPGNDPELNWGDYGKITTINFQYKKR